MAVCLTNRTLLANAWAFFVFGYFLFFFMGWLPDYLGRTFHLSLRSVGLFAFLPWGAGAGSLFLLGRWSDRILCRTGRLRLARTWLIISTQVVAACAVIPVVYARDANVAILFISVAVSMCMAANSAYLAVALDVAPAQAGLALGVMDGALAISGFLAPTLTGFIVSATGSFGAAFGVMGVRRQFGHGLLPFSSSGQGPPGHDTVTATDGFRRLLQHSRQQSWLAKVDPG